jgi:hypothetical protein
VEDLPHAPAAAGGGRAVAVVRGRSDLGPNIPFKWLCILPGVMIVCFLFSRW